MSIRDLIWKTKPITPHDTNVLPLTCGLTVDNAGNVAMTFQDGSTDTLYLAAGIAHSYRVTQVKNTGTTAAGIHAIYTQY